MVFPAALRHYVPAPARNPEPRRPENGGTHTAPGPPLQGLRRGRAARATCGQQGLEGGADKSLINDGLLPREVTGLQPGLHVPARIGLATLGLGTSADLAKTTAIPSIYGSLPEFLTREATALHDGENHLEHRTGWNPKKINRMANTLVPRPSGSDLSRPSETAP